MPRTKAVNEADIHHRSSWSGLSSVKMSYTARAQTPTTGFRGLDLPMMHRSPLLCSNAAGSLIQDMRFLGHIQTHGQIRQQIRPYFTEIKHFQGDRRSMHCAGKTWQNQKQPYLASIDFNVVLMPACSKSSATLLEPDAQVANSLTRSKYVWAYS